MFAGRGGRERSAAEIAAELARRGHEVSVLCQEGEPPADGVQVVPLGAGGVGGAGRLARLAFATDQAARRCGFDVVHALLAVPCATVYQPRGGTVAGMLAAGRRRAGAIGRVFQPVALLFNRKRRLARRFERNLLANLDVPCLPISRLVAEELACYYGRRENVHVIYGGVAVADADDEQRGRWRAEWRRRWGAEGDATVFLTVAQNFALKGVGEAVGAFAEHLRARPGRADKLVVVGRGPARRYRRLAARAGIDRRVIFHGPTDDVFPLYSAADAVVLLSWQDACSRVVLEALRWGVPSLTTRFNGASEILDGGAGKVVESPRDQSAVVAALGELADPDRRQAMSRACRSAAEAVSIERHVDGLERVYQEVSPR